MRARLFLSPLDEPLATLDIAEPTRLLDVFPDAEVMEWFSDGGAIRLAGKVIPPDKWRLVTVKPRAAVDLDFVYVPGNKRAFALLATVALVALTTAVSFGLAAPFLGAGFAAGTFGAQALAAGLGLAGSLALSALTAPPKAQGGEQQKELSQAGVSGNTLTLLDTLPVIEGCIGYSPPYLAPPYTTWDGDDVYAHAVVGVQGRCLIEDVRMNGLPIADFAGASYETREGGGSASDRTMFTQTVIEEREGITLSNFKTKAESTYNDVLSDQDDPDSVSPQYHVFRTAGAWDRVVLRLMFPSGILYLPTGTYAAVPLRIEMRKVGDVAWRNLPTFHIWDAKYGTGPMRAEISIERIKQPPGRHFSSAIGEYPIFDVVAKTGIGMSFAYDADAYFLGPAAGASPWYLPGAVPLLTGYTGGGYTVSASSEFNTSYRAWYATDAASTGGTYWRPANNSLPATWKVQCPSAKTFRSYTIWCDVATYTPTQWMVRGSNDGSTWVELDSADTDVSANLLRAGTYQIENPGSYLYYDIVFKANNGAANQQLQVGYINFHEVDAPGLAMTYNDPSGAGTAQGFMANYGGGYMYAACRYVSLDKKGARVFCDPDQWDEGEYEIRVKRGVALYYTQYSSSSGSSSATPYQFNSSATNADYFDHRLTSGIHKIYIGQKNYRSDMMVEAFQTISAESPFDDTGVAMIAVSAPNVQISSLYAKFTRYAPVWDGTIWDAVAVPTSNPAALFRQELLGGANADPVPGECVDEDALADWYETCEANGYECNVVLSGSRVGEAKQLLATAGYAAPRDADLYGVIEDKDTSAEPVRYLISPLNSEDEGTTNDLPRIPDAIRAEFFDEDQSYAVEHVLVYRDGMDAATAKLIETVSYPGFTNLAKATARARFDLRQAQLRQTRYRRRVGLDCLNLRRGMLVGLQDDVIDGKTAAGWITAVTVVAGNVVSVTLDNIMPWSAADSLDAVTDIEALTDVLDPSQPMGVAIRVPGQSALLKQVSDVSDSNVCTFTTPFADDGSVTVGLMVVAGAWGNVVRRCKVMADPSPRGIHERVLVLADEAPGLFG